MNHVKTNVVCLFLVVVMVYLHGGNFVAGAGSVLLYDGTHFANVTEVITVGVNYRLGAFGYLDIRTSLINFASLSWSCLSLKTILGTGSAPLTRQLKGSVCGPDCF